MTKTEKGLLEALKKSENVLDSLWLQTYIHLGEECSEKVAGAIREAKAAIEVAETAMEAARSAPGKKRKAYVYHSHLSGCRPPQYHLSVYEDTTRKRVVVTVHALSQVDMQRLVHEIFSLSLKDGRKPTGAYFAKLKYGLSELVLEFSDVTMTDAKSLARGVAVTLDALMAKCHDGDAAQNVA